MAMDDSVGVFVVVNVVVLLVIPLQTLAIVTVPPEGLIGVARPEESMDVMVGSLLVQVFTEGYGQVPPVVPSK
jgi:hypothetical protein